MKTKRSSGFFESVDVSSEDEEKHFKWAREQYAVFLAKVKALPEREALPVFYDIENRELETVDEKATTASQNLYQYVRGERSHSLDSILYQYAESSYAYDSSSRRDRVTIDLKTIIEKLDFTFDELFFLIVSAMVESPAATVSHLAHVCLPLLKQKISDKDTEGLQAKIETLEKNIPLCERERTRIEINKIEFDLQPFIAEFLEFYSRFPALRRGSPDIDFSNALLNQFFLYGKQKSSFKDFLIFLRDFSWFHLDFLQAESGNPYIFIFNAIQAYVCPLFSMRMLFRYTPNSEMTNIFKLDTLKYPLSTFPAGGAVNFIYRRLQELFPFEDIPVRLTEEELSFFTRAREHAEEILPTAAKKIVIPPPEKARCTIL